MATCELGNHGRHPEATTLKWCCNTCLEIFRENVNEIAEQAQLDRQFKLDNRRSPYRLVPYYALTLAFDAFLLVLFL